MWATLSPVLTWPGSNPSLAGVPHHPDLAGGYPIPDQVLPIWTWQGYPHLDLARVPPVLTILGSYLGPLTGVPPERTWDQLKYYGMEMGYPSPAYGQRDTCEKVPSRRTKYVGGKKINLFCPQK